MSPNKSNEDKVEKLLRKMPRVEDNQDKDALFSKVSASMNKKDTTRKKPKFPWLIPSIGSVVVVFLCVLIYQSFPSDNQFSFERNSDDSVQDTTEESTDSSFNAQMDKRESDESGSISQNEESAENEALIMEGIEEAASSKLVYPDSNVSFISVAVMDPSIHYTIPMQLVDTSTNEADPEYYYNQLGNFIDEEAFDVVIYPFEDINFDIVTEENEVHLDIPNDFELEEGSALAGMFERILSVMFHPNEIDEAVLNLDESRDSFGMYGNIDRLPLTKQENQSYKIFQRDESKPELLLPTSTNEFETLEEALEEMKLSEPEFHVEASIPSEVELNVESSNQLVTISFSNSVSFGNNQETLNMLEAILLTAKSFGYSEVRFDMQIDTVGPYRLTDPLPVPVGANPIYLH
ncbi:GerMN domain-containing protein [Aquibacillus albus]|uniref:GerMN domain-containing protein n=1 Tax=Aquibacillus albus TaxID=1168171 RepID=A0ABS2MV73_9BACI|nr:GerMN domain-containing protein [Aquibacillus albus]MBM7569792.1 hypothetical protein [Aquibacillus albus]